MKHSLRILLVSIFSLFSLSACSLPAMPRVPTLEERAKVKILIEKATVEIKTGEIGKAKAYVDIAEALAPNDPRVIDAKGCIAWYYKDYFEAKKHFDNAILIDRSFENAYVNLAYIEEQKGRIIDAKIILENVLKINPLNHKARNNYAALLYDNFNQEEAKSQLQMAIGSVEEIGQVLLNNKRIMLD